MNKATLWIALLIALPLTACEQASQHATDLAKKSAQEAIDGAKQAADEALGLKGEGGKDEEGAKEKEDEKEKD